MAITIDDIARVAGVGRTTVYRALQDKDRISMATKERIKRIADEMSYQPNPIASSLAKGTSNYIGVLATRGIFTVFDAIIGPMDKLLRQAGYSILLFTSSENPEDEHLLLQELMRHRVAGVIIHPSSTPASPEVYQKLVDSGIKVVIIDRYLENINALQIVGDDYRAVYLATEYLISLGHCEIAHLAIPDTSYAGRERARGFRDAFKAAGIPINESIIVDTPMGAEYGYQSMSNILKSGTKPTAVLARQDVVAVGAMRAIYEAGLSIPDDISIIGNGDYWCDDMLRPALTTVHYPMDKMAAVASEMLLSMLAGETVEIGTEVLDVALVIRDSCAAVH